MLRKYWKEWVAVSLTCISLSAVGYGYFKLLNPLLNSYPVIESETEDISNFQQSRYIQKKRKSLFHQYEQKENKEEFFDNSSKNSELEEIISKFNYEIFEGKNYTFIPENEETEGFNCLNSYVYFKIKGGQARFDFPGTNSLTRKKIIGSQCWNISYNLYFPSRVKVYVNENGEVENIRRTCYGVGDINIQRFITMSKHPLQNCE